MWTKPKLAVFLILSILACALHFAFPPTPQPESYHAFAGDVAWLGIPHFQNVVSNLGFLIVGLVGLNQVLRKKIVSTSHDSILKEASVFFFFSMVLLCFGSGYYHWAPTTDTLFWDRFTMVLGFMTFLSMVISDRLASPKFNKTQQFTLWFALLALGVYSVVDWRWSEQRGAGDMRLYQSVQVFSLLYLLFFAFAFPDRRLKKKILAQSVGWYAVAKVLEAADGKFYDLFHGITAGHPLKHLAAAMGVYFVLKAIKPTPEQN